LGGRSGPLSRLEDPLRPVPPRSGSRRQSDPVERNRPRVKIAGGYSAESVGGLGYTWLKKRAYR
jgi:hypothetical protein